MHLQAKLQTLVLFLVFRAFLQVVKGIDAAFRLARAGLRRAAHPFQFVLQQLAVALRRGAFHFFALAAFLHIIVEIAVVGVHHALIEFKNLIAHSIKEITVVRDHQQGHAGLGEKLLQPFHHLHIQVVGRLVKDQEIRLMQ